MRSYFRISLMMIVALLSLAGASEASSILVNGDFQTGDLTGWTVFTTANGTNGAGLPAVVSFDTTGSGASLAAKFDVGDASFDGTQQGGGLSQTFSAPTAGLYSLFANIAALDDADGEINTDAGTFSLLVDGSVLVSQSLGAFISPGQILRSSLSISTALSAGSHTFAIQATRRFGSFGDQTPTQYFDNISITAPAVPEPTAVVLLGTGLFIGVMRGRRKPIGRS